MRSWSSMVSVASCSVSGTEAPRIVINQDTAILCPERDSSRARAWPRNGSESLRVVFVAASSYGLSLRGRPRVDLPLLVDAGPLSLQWFVGCDAGSSDRLIRLEEVLEPGIEQPTDAIVSSHQQPGRFVAVHHDRDGENLGGGVTAPRRPATDRTARAALVLCFRNATIAVGRHRGHRKTVHGLSTIWPRRESTRAS